MKKVILITGISSGFGKETARLLSQQGHIVYGTVRKDTKPLEHVNYLRMDLTDIKSIREAVLTIVEKEGRIDALINNAGITTFKSILETKIPDFDNIINTNLRGTFLCIKAVLPNMTKFKKGHIINILSVASKTVFEDSAAYSASKAGAFALTNVLRKEVRKFNVKVSSILPGAVETPMWDSKTRQKYHNRMLSPSDIAQIALNIFSQPKKVLIEDVFVRPIKGDL